jgi:endonuclease III
MAAHRDIADAVLTKCGTTYAAEAGIRLADKPAPLYQLAVLTTVLSTRISADIAVAAAHELYRAGFRTPKKMADSTWQQRVDALGRGHYRRYDESTATMLGRGAELISERWAGDLRRLRGDNLRAEIMQLPGVGDVGADIFCREVQEVWPELRPFVDHRATRGAESVGLPSDPHRLADLVSGTDLARFIAGLVRLSLDKNAAAALTNEV